MNRHLAVALTCAAVCVAAACSSGGSEPMTSSATQTSVASSTAATNVRNAVEVKLGEPVTVTSPGGGLVLKIADTRLDATGCSGSHPEVKQVKFVATIQTGDKESDQWLWPSDFYYVNSAGKVAQNREVEEAADIAYACDGSVEFINVPPNSTMDGSPTIVIPNETTTVGYHLTVGGVDQRVEWKLPAGWQDTVAPEVAAPATEVPATTEPEPAPPAAEAPETEGGIPPGWDKNGDGLIDTDAPIGDDCDTPECLLGETP